MFRSLHKPSPATILSIVALLFATTGTATAASLGPTGPQGPAGLSGVETVSAQSSFDSLAFKGVIVTCPAGKTVIGGGAPMISPTTSVALSTSMPTGRAPAGMHWPEVNSTSFNWLVRAYAICANVG